MPRVLIVDDEPVSLHFFQAALHQLGCEAVGAGDMAGALVIATSTPIDLLLLDRRLPGGSGAQLLAILRSRGIAAPAIATSAEIDAEVATEFRNSGFAAWIEKPTSLARLEDVLRPWLALSTRASPLPALLDDAGALLAIGGDPTALQALRTLFAQELARLQQDLASGYAADTSLLERLHRLRASCGFCGTPALAQATIALERALRSKARDAQTVLNDFLDCCRRTTVLLVQAPELMHR